MSAEIAALVWLAGAGAAGVAPADGEVATRALAALAGDLPVVDAGRPCPAGDPLAGVIIRDRHVQLCTGGSRRRQLLFAAISRLDQQRGWSRQPAWRRLNGWERSALPAWRWQARNRAAEAHAAPLGRQSPALDLATFAASWLDGEPELGCRLLPQARFVAARLRELGWVTTPSLTCPAFEAWARRQHLSHVELTLATPSTVTMASMFGHVFLRLVEHASAEGEPPVLEDRTIAFLVETRVPVTEESFYAVKGIAGAYEASLVERSFLETYRTYVVAEGRDLRRFRLDLTPAETGALLERIWSLRQAGRYRYYFFAANCATLMVDLINDVLPPERHVRYPEALATTPAGTLEGYATATAASGGPLATFVPETILSFEHEARLSARERGRLATRLVAADPRFAPLWQAIRTGDEAARAAAYLRLAGGRSGADLQRFLRASALVEAHLSTLANQQAEDRADRARRQRLREALARAVAEVAGGRAGCARAAENHARQAAGDDATARLVAYRGLQATLEGPCLGDPAGADQVRRVALLAMTARHDGDALDSTLEDRLLFPDPALPLGQQRFARGLVALIDHPYVTRVSPALLAVQRTQRALATSDQASPDRLRREEAALRRNEEAELHARSLPRTGIDELEVGTAVDASHGSPLVMLGGALHDEHLGDQRRFGFPPHTALTVVRTRTALSWQRDRPALADWQARALGYRSLPPRLEPSAWLPSPGGEVSLDLAGRSGGRPLSMRLAAGALVPLLASTHLAHHLLVGAGAVAGGDWGGPRPAVGVAGGSLAVEGRASVTGRPGRWIRTRAEWRPLWTTAGPAREALLTTDLRLPLLEALPWTRSALVLRLAGQLHASTLPLGPRRERRVALTLALE